MGMAVKSFVAALVCFVAVVVPASAGVAQDAPPPSLPPGIPTVTPPTVVPPSEGGDEPAPPPVVIDDPSPKVAQVMAQLHLLDMQQALATSQAALDAAQVDEARVRAARDAAQRDHDAKRQQMTSAITDAYVSGLDDGSAIDAVDADYVPAESAHLLATSAIERDQALVKAAAAQLQAAEQALTDAITRTAQAQAARDGAQSAVTDAENAVHDAHRLTNAKDVSPSVMGDPVLTAAEIVGWYYVQGIQGYVAGVDLTTLTGYYVDEGNAEHIRGDVAFAQSVIETGAFTSPLTTHNNFAGIGACDSCATGFDFPSPQMGVRAQAQLLHAYADKDLRTAMLANPSVGSDPDTLGVRGCCMTWNRLTGTWASDPNYGPKIMTVYLSMLQFALQQRTQPPPPPPTAVP
jgi:hypothetical protein